MINGHSLVGLSHQEAVAILRSTAGLVQLVVASRVSLRANQPHIAHESVFMSCSPYKVCQPFKHVEMSHTDACSS